LTLAQAKNHLRIDAGFVDDDSYINILITVAREYCEDFTHRSIGVSTFELVLDMFPQNRNYIEMIMSPLISVESVSYTNAGAIGNTMDPVNYIVDKDRLPGAIFLPYYGIWPVLVPYPGAAVRIAFTAGHTLANLPARFLQAMLLLIGHWYDHREEVSTERNIESLPVGVDSLLWPLRVFSNGDFNGHAPLDSYIGGAYYGVR
jgi:uncharacterized phiE125 gp8 family phage protein